MHTYDDLRAMTADELSSVLKLDADERRAMTSMPTSFPLTAAIAALLVNDWSICGHTVVDELSGARRASAAMGIAARLVMRLGSNERSALAAALNDVIAQRA